MQVTKRYHRLLRGSSAGKERFCKLAYQFLKHLNQLQKCFYPLSHIHFKLGNMLFLRLNAGCFSPNVRTSGFSLCSLIRRKRAFELRNALRIIKMSEDPDSLGGAWL